MLIHQRLKGVGDIAGRGGQKVGELRQRSGEQPGNLGQYLQTRRHVGEGRHLLGIEHFRAQDAALDNQVLIGFGELAQRLRDFNSVAFDESDGRWAGQHCVGVETILVCSDAHQRVFEDTERSTGRAQGGA